MSIIIKSGATTDVLTVDPTSKAARVTLYDTTGAASPALTVSGNVASGATDSGNPVKAGGVFNSSPPTFTTGQRADLQVDTNGRLLISQIANQGTNVAQISGTSAVTAGVSGLLAVGGNVASAATDSGNPLKVGAVFNTVLPTFTSGQRGDLQIDANGRLFTTQAANESTNISQIAGTNTVTAGVAGLLAVAGNVASGTADSGNPLKIGGVFNSTLPALTAGQRSDIQLDSQGKLLVTLGTGVKATFKACTTQFTPAATPTDVVTIFGSATRTIRVLSIALSNIQTATGINTWSILKRSTADTAGTSTSPAKIPLDSNLTAATATVLQYSANPTQGTSLGSIATTRVLSPIITGLDQAEYIWDFTNSTVLDPPVLRGTGEGLCLNFAGAALPAGLVINAIITWTEEL